MFLWRKQGQSRKERHLFLYNSCNFYRPQTKLRKRNVFKACVKNFVNRGGVHIPLGRHPLADTSPETATAADGTHPTGMHSYLWKHVQTK